jgi:hypothetical protein
MTYGAGMQGCGVMSAGMWSGYGVHRDVGVWSAGMRGYGSRGRDMHTQMGASFLLKGFKVLFFIYFLIYIFIIYKLYIIYIYIYIYIYIL